MDKTHLDITFIQETCTCLISNLVFFSKHFIQYITGYFEIPIGELQNACNYSLELVQFRAEDAGTSKYRMQHPSFTQ